MLKKVKKEYENNKIKQASNNNKRLWEAINDVTHRKRKSDDLTPLLTLCNEPVRSLDSVNDYFCDVGESLAEKFTNSSFTTPTSTSNQEKNPNSFLLIPTDVNEVHKIILTLRDSCSTGWDNISNKLLKTNADILVPPLTHICNLSLATGCFPRAFKKAIIRPILRTGTEAVSAITDLLQFFHLVPKCWSVL